jgi:hypothetical protein
MTFIVAGTALASAAIGASASRSAARTQAAAADRASELQREQFDRQVELQEPWRRSGIAAQNQLLTLLGINPNPPPKTIMTSFGAIPVPTKNGIDSGLTVDASSPDFGKYGKAFSETNFTTDPGYAFRLSEGMKALERSAAARGGLLSGATMKGLQRYGQDLASQEYQNAFNRYYAERNAALNPLQSLAGLGQTSTQALGAAGQTYAGNVGNLMGQAAQARASGYVGGANALTGALGSYLNYSQGQSLVNALRDRRGQGAPISEAAPVPQYYSYPGQDY